MFRLRGRRLLRATGLSKAPDKRYSTVTEYPVSGQGGNAAGVVIDGALYTLAGEPPTAKPGNWFKFH